MEEKIWKNCRVEVRDKLNKSKLYEQRCSFSYGMKYVGKAYKKGGDHLQRIGNMLYTASENWGKVIGTNISGKNYHFGSEK